MTPDYLKRSWPSASLLLLLKAYSAPDDAAAKAWREWVSTGDLDKSGWPEVRLLAAVAERLPVLDPNTPIRGRLEGIRRFVWTRNQMRLMASLPALDALLAVKVPLMLLKGGARIASDQAAASARYLRDIDILVPRGDMAAAIDALRRAGFRASIGRLPGEVRAAPFDKDHVQSSETAPTEIDLHWSALRMGRTADHDGRLWSRARTVEILGRAVQVPSASDQLIIALAHGVVADTDRPADWVIDAVTCLRDRSLDWRVVADEARARRLEVPIASGLALLSEELGLDVPGEIRDAVGEGAKHWLFMREFGSEATERRERGPLTRMTSSLAEWVRSRGLGQTAGPSAPRVSVVPLLGPARRNWQVLVVGGTTRLAAPIGGRLSLAVDLGDWPGRFDFDVFLNGLWSARVKVRRRGVLRKLVRRWSIRIALPERWSGAPIDSIGLIPVDAEDRPRAVAGIKAFAVSG